MDRFDTDTLKRLTAHYLERADLCRKKAADEDNLYFRKHLLGRASGFEDAAFMLVSRFPEAKP